MVKKDDAPNYAAGNVGQFNSFKFNVFKFPNYETGKLWDVIMVLPSSEILNFLSNHYVVDFTCTITVCHTDTNDCFLILTDPDDPSSTKIPADGKCGAADNSGGIWESSPSRRKRSSSQNDDDQHDYKLSFSIKPTERSNDETHEHGDHGDHEGHGHQECKYCSNFVEDRVYSSNSRKMFLSSLKLYFSIWCDDFDKFSCPARSPYLTSKETVSTTRSLIKQTLVPCVWTRAMIPEKKLYLRNKWDKWDFYCFWYLRKTSLNVATKPMSGSDQH